MSTSDLEHKSEEEQGEDQFIRVPKHVFIFILTKLHQQDFKFLFRCSLISKLFCSSIPLMSSVSISISAPNSPKPTSDFSKSSLEDFTDRFIDSKKEYWTSQRPQIENAMLFLKKFNNIQSLDVLFITNDDEDEAFPYSLFPSSINWKTKFDFKLQSFVFLFAQSVLRKTEQTEEAMAVLDEITSEQLDLHIYSGIFGFVDSYKSWNVMSSLLVQHPLISKITVAVLRKGVRNCLRDQEIVAFRNSLTPEDNSRIGGIKNRMRLILNVKSGYVPVLFLPSSGYVMKGVSLVVLRSRRLIYEPGEDGYSDRDSDDDTDEDNEEAYIEYDDSHILDWDFESDEEVFREAITSILVHHKDKMHIET